MNERDASDEIRGWVGRLLSTPDVVRRRGVRPGERLPYGRELMHTASSAHSNKVSNPHALSDEQSPQETRSAPTSIHQVNSNTVPIAL